MSGKKLLLDSNIVIYLANKKLELSSIAEPEDIMHISSISYMECLGYNFESKKQEKIATLLCDSFEQIYITDEIIKQTIKIRKKVKIKLPDAIIAASAISHGLKLITHNSKDFTGVNDLDTIDPIK